MRMKKNKEVNLSLNLSSNDNGDNKLYTANPFPGLSMSE